jgi:hypothetical protein
LLSKKSAQRRTPSQLKAAKYFAPFVAVYDEDASSSMWPLKFPIVTTPPPGSATTAPPNAKLPKSFLQRNVPSGQSSINPEPFPSLVLSDVPT